MLPVSAPWQFCNFTGFSLVTGTSYFVKTFLIKPWTIYSSTYFLIFSVYNLIQPSNSNNLGFTNFFTQVSITTSKNELQIAYHLVLFFKFVSIRLPGFFVGKSSLAPTKNSPQKLYQSQASLVLVVLKFKMQSKITEMAIIYISTIV